MTHTTGPVCWHCLLRELEVTWRPPSTKYPTGFTGYVHRAKVAAVIPRGPLWEGQVLLAVDGHFPVEDFRSEIDAKRWCAETVQRWFGQLDHN